IGRCRAGVQNALSTASSAPARLATAASAAMSELSVCGFEVVSRKSSRVLGLHARCHSSTCVGETNVVSTPKRLRMPPKSETVATLTMTKPELRQCASLCSLNSVRLCPARTPSVATSNLSLIKKPDPLSSTTRTWFPRHALAAFVARPQAVAQVGANLRKLDGIISRLVGGREVGAELRRLG